MNLNKDIIDNLLQSYPFYKEQHRNLTGMFLRRVSGKVNFRLEQKKASIHLTAGQTFSVIVLRRSQNKISAEFYSERELDNPRAEYRIERDGMKIHRVEINSEKDMDGQLMDWIVESYRLVRG